MVSKGHVEEAPRDLTLDKLLAQYRRCERIYKQSSFWKALQHILTTMALDEDIVVENCICLGLGSPSAPLYHMDRRDVSLYQLAAFRAVVETIRKSPFSPVHLFTPVIFD